MYQVKRKENRLIFFKMHFEGLELSRFLGSSTISTNSSTLRICNTHVLFNIWSLLICRSLVRLDTQHKPRTAFDLNYDNWLVVSRHVQFWSDLKWTWDSIQILILNSKTWLEIWEVIEPFNSEKSVSNSLKSFKTGNYKL